MRQGPGDVTLLLNAVRNGEHEAESELLSLIYDELRRMAARHLRGEQHARTLQTTDLVHEAYLKLAGQHSPFQNRAHFLGVAAQAMRRILVDHARAHHAEKRGGNQTNLPLDEALRVSSAQSAELIELDEALTRLAQIDARQARIVELRFFTGLSVEEASEVLGCTPRTVNRDWRMAQAWLRRQLRHGGQP